MELSDLDPTTRSAFAQLCRDEGLDPSYTAFVARHVDADDGTWRWCCGSNCDPCVARLGRVVDAARGLLRTRGAPPGLPAPGEPA
ncbi:MAG: hypothetical protein H6835_18300 [Planctomycetes bacterium]|nr:hypothetical protein [Planctomycetota bacterium]